MSKLILFQGDSITDCERNRTYSSLPGMGYPTLVKARLGFEYPGEYQFLNKGVSGNRIVDVYARIKNDIINLKPDYLSILIGVNDVWHELDGVHNGVAAPKFELIYDLLITEIREALPDVKIMLLAPFVLEGNATQNTDSEPDRWETFRTETALRAAATKRIAEKHGLPFVELQSKFEALCEKAPADYWLTDGVHPHTMGHELIAREWIKTFKEQLK